MEKKIKIRENQRFKEHSRLSFIIEGNFEHDSSLLITQQVMLHIISCCTASHVIIYNCHPAKQLFIS